MLTPNYLEQLPQPMIALVNELQEEIISELTKRLVKANVLTPSSEWLLYKANQLRLSSAAVNKIIAKNAKVRERVIRELYTEAVKLALNEDAKIYRYAISEGALDPVSGAKLTSYFKSVALNDTFKKGLAATNGLMRNLTNSMAAVSNRMLSDALDLAWLEVASGAFTPDEAVYKAIEKLAEKGLAVVEYKSGHKDQVDVAVRRAVRTGINKTCCDMQLDLANEMGSDLVEVSSHFGARPTHAEWQGQIYSISGKHPKYKPFSVTGYGRGDGLGGWNCRHNFYPFFEGISLPASETTFTEAENLEYYKKTQKQRGYERAVRRSKRELAALDSARINTSDAALKAKLDKEFARKSSVLKKREKRLNDFCRDNGLLKDSSRTRVNGFGKSVSQKAVWADRKKSVQNITPKTLDKSGGSGIMKMGKNKNAYKQIAPDFSTYAVTENLESVAAVKKYLSSELNIPENKLDFSGLKNAEVLEPFAKRFVKIKNDTDFKLSGIIVSDVIDGDVCCIACYKPYENTLYISSRYFNSKQALTDTLRDWANNGIMPKQCKNIQYLAEHEAAHIRIPDNVLNDEKAVEIWKKRKLKNHNDKNICEYYADVVAIYKNLSTYDENVQEAIDYLKSKGVKI